MKNTAQISEPILELPHRKHSASAKKALLAEISRTRRMTMLERVEAALSIHSRFAGIMPKKELINGR